MEIYEKNSHDYADALKNLGYTYVTLAETESLKENCKLAIESYKSALEVYSADIASFEHAEIQRDIGYTYLLLSDVEDKAENCKKSVKAYKKAFKAYSDSSREFESVRDTRSAEAREKADKCQNAIEACRKILKTSRKAMDASAKKRRDTKEA